MAREIEVKLLADGASYDEALILVQRVVGFQGRKMLHSGLVDIYWPSLPQGQAESLRLRIGDDVELTTKVIDKGSIVDRVEHNLTLDKKQGDAALELLTSALGEPETVLYRFMEVEVEGGTLISVVQNLNKQEWCFVEVEGPSVDEVNRWVAELRSQAKAEGTVDFKQVKNSFFDIFVKRNGVRL